MMKDKNSRLSEITADFEGIKEAAAQLQLLVPQLSNDAVRGHKATLETSKNYSLTAKINCVASIAMIILFIVFLLTAGTRLENLEARDKARAVAEGLAAPARSAHLKATRDLLNRLEEAERTIETLVK